MNETNMMQSVIIGICAATLLAGCHSSPMSNDRSGLADDDTGQAVTEVASEHPSGTGKVLANRRGHGESQYISPQDNSMADHNPASFVGGMVILRHRGQISKLSTMIVYGDQDTGGYAAFLMRARTSIRSSQDLRAPTIEELVLQLNSDPHADYDVIAGDASAFSEFTRVLSTDEIVRFRRLLAY